MGKKIKITKEISLIIIALIFATAYIFIEIQKLDYKEKIRQEKIKESKINIVFFYSSYRKSFGNSSLTEEITPALIPAAFLRLAGTIFSI